MPFAVGNQQGGAGVEKLSEEREEVREVTGQKDLGFV